MNAIILAAGNSKRFGENKLLYPIQGKEMYKHVLDHMYALLEKQYIQNLIVVTQYDQIENEIKRDYSKVNVIRNSEPELGVSQSIRLGIEYLKQIDKRIEACLFSVADQPFISEESLIQLIQEWNKGEMGIVSCASWTSIGNPVIFSEKYYTALSKLTGDKGGKGIVMENLNDTQLFEIPEIELEDVDVKGIYTKE